MKRIIISLFFISVICESAAKKTEIISKDSLEIESFFDRNEEETHNLDNLFRKRLKNLDRKSPMDLAYNEKVKPFILNYIGANKRLISKMQGIAPFYFNLFEEMLDKYNLPLELKYLPIVESALNPRAKSKSGAAGLWQFMYLTGKEYNLNVTSYIDERQDPIKSTEAACIYLSKLYEMFGDWNLVLAAYNGGPGYVQRKIISTDKDSFWELHDHLRKETRNYIPTFIAVNYAMNYAEKHDIEIIKPKINLSNIDTIVLKKQVDYIALKEVLCINEETFQYLNPSYKRAIYPEGGIIRVSLEQAKDFRLNEETNYNFIEMVASKEILIDEIRLVYNVKQGDYLGKIAQENDVRVFQIREWNNLKSSKLDIGDKLVLFVKKETNQKILTGSNQEYIIKKGDTLWGIIQKLEGVSISEIKKLNELDNDNLTPGEKILIPTT